MFAKKYLNEYHETIRENNALKVTLMALILVIFIEGFFIIKTMDTQRTIVIPSVRGKYEITANSANADYLVQMGYYLSSLMETFTPQTVKSNYYRFLEYVAPEVYDSMKSAIMSEADKFISTDTSSFFSPLAYKIYKDNTLIITGKRMLITAGKVVSDTKINVKIKYKIVHGKFEVVAYEEEKTH